MGNFVQESPMPKITTYLESTYSHCYLKFFFRCDSSKKIFAQFCPIFGVQLLELREKVHFFYFFIFFLQSFTLHGWSEIQKKLGTCLRFLAIFGPPKEQKTRRLPVRPTAGRKKIPSRAGLWGSLPMVRRWAP